MNRTSTFRTYAQNASIRPAAANSDTHSVVTTDTGCASVSFHLGADTQSYARKFDRRRTPDQHSFATVTVEWGDWSVERAGSLDVFVTPDTIDQAVALRNALNQAINFARRMSRQEG